MLFPLSSTARPDSAGAAPEASELPGLDARDFGTYSYSSGGAYGYGSGAYGYGSGGALGGFESMGGRSSRSRDEEDLRGAPIGRSWAWAASALSQNISGLDSTKLFLA